MLYGRCHTACWRLLSSVQDRLKSSSSLLDTIQTWVSEVPNLDKVLTGPVRAAWINWCETRSVRWLSRVTTVGISGTRVRRSIFACTYLLIYILYYIYMHIFTHLFLGLCKLSVGLFIYQSICATYVYNIHIDNNKENICTQKESNQYIYICTYITVCIICPFACVSVSLFVCLCGHLSFIRP